MYIRPQNNKFSVFHFLLIPNKIRLYPIRIEPLEAFELDHL